MAEAANFPLALQLAESAAPTHSAAVRITHWINTLSVVCLLISGIAILLAHPRLYWGETGNSGTPSLIDLPLPFVLVGQTGWGRHLHFLAAWICVLNGLIYLAAGVSTRHFRRNLLGRGRVGRPGYSVPQKLAYSVVIFVLFPLIVWTGLAMSPAIAAICPAIVTTLGGQQSARTIHFVVASLILAFFAGHVVMVWRAGLAIRVRAMIWGAKGVRP